MSTNSYNSGDSEDFFTKLSFSTLMTELSDKENIMIENMALPTKPVGITKVDREVERWLNSKSDQELINLIMM